MPYKKGNRLPGEKASKLGHLDVLNSDLVNSLIENFESSELEIKEDLIAYENYDVNSEVLKLIFAVDGSLQTIQSDGSPFKELTFVKTALFRLDQTALSKVDPESPHPLALRDIMSDSALFHATVFPLKNVFIPGMNVYNSVRYIIYESFKDSKLGGEVIETLKWLAYEKWDGVNKNSPNFECPHCRRETNGLKYDLEKDNCIHCKEEIFISDMLGFHLEMTDDSAANSVASAYMLIHETLLLFTGIRHFWEQRKYSVLEDCLFIKDGPLSLRGQYVKIVDPIRNFFEFVKANGHHIYLIGQEKSGAFFDHLQIISSSMPNNSFFIPSNEYIRTQIQKRSAVNEYGYRTNYGNKVFVKTDDHHSLVISVPTGNYLDTSNRSDLLGLDKILGSLNQIRSYKHEGALIPIELANGIASLSTYPSARILKIFSGI